MDIWEQRLYCGELTRQCRFAFAAFEDINCDLQRMQESENRKFEAWQEFKCQASLDDGLPDFGLFEIPNPADLLPKDRIFYDIQALLVAVGNVSKFLWPSINTKNSKYARVTARAVELRKVLQVPDNSKDSPLGPRNIRNKYEHFDEVLDEVVARGVSVADTSINIIGHVTGNPITYLRNF